MFDRNALCRQIALAALMLGSAVIGVVPAGTGHAGDTQVSTRAFQPYAGTRAVPRAALGSYSTTLSEILGLPEMPPAPKDFGPHFDFPAGGSETLNGPPDRSPYPN
jgi:hypothetical protein